MREFQRKSACRRPKPEQALGKAPPTSATRLPWPARRQSFRPVALRPTLSSGLPLSAVHFWDQFRNSYRNLERSNGGCRAASDRRVDGHCVSKLAGWFTLVSLAPCRTTMKSHGGISGGRGTWPHLPTGAY